MPTLSDVQPDNLDLDYFYANHPKSFGVGICKETPNTSRSIPTNRKPNSCITTQLRGAVKSSYYFEAPATSSTVTCLCSKYHTRFVSAQNLTYQRNKITKVIKKPNDKKSLATSIADSILFIPHHLHPHQHLLCTT